MKKFILITIILLFCSAGAFIVLRQKQGPQVNINTSSMEIKSPAFQQNSNIPSKYTCDGENINPPLTIFWRSWKNQKSGIDCRRPRRAA